MKMADLTGRVVGRLTVQEVGPKQGRKIMWVCTCECGRSKLVRADHLVKGLIRSCGCFWAERRVEANTTHGMTGTRPYRIWRDMINRCHYEHYPERHLYGGRGIIVCKRWRDSFEDFLADMGMPPIDRSIDRIDVNGNYEPGNCRWATALEQSQNKRPKAAVLVGSD